MGNQPTLPHAPERSGPCGNRPGLSLSPWCTSSRRHGHHPFPTPILPKSSQEHFFRASLIFLGVLGWRRETPASRVTCSEGEIFAHRLYSLFLLALGHPRPRCLGPSSLRLLPCQAWWPHSLFQAPGGAPRSPQVKAGEKQPSSPLLLFSLCKSLGPSCSPHTRGGGGRRVTPPLLPWSFCCVNPHEMLVL